MVVSFKR